MQDKTCIMRRDMSRISRKSNTAAEANICKYDNGSKLLGWLFRKTISCIKSKNFFLSRLILIEI